MELEKVMLLRRLYIYPFYDCRQGRRTRACSQESWNVPLERCDSEPFLNMKSHMLQLTVTYQ